MISILNATIQGVVTLIDHVELFTTGIKWNQRINFSIYWKWSDQGMFQRGDQTTDNMYATLGLEMTL